MTEIMKDKPEEIWGRRNKGIDLFSVAYSPGKENKSVPLFFNIFRPEKIRMRFTAEVVNITKYPLTIGLLCVIAIVVISKDLSYLVH